MPSKKADDTTLSAETTAFYLSVASPKDKPWDVHRQNADQVQDLYASTDFERYSQRIQECSQWLKFAVVLTEAEALGLKLHAAHFCRVRFCPVCQWRRSLMWRARFFQAVPRIFEARPTARFIFLTLTVRNCELGELRSTIEQMNKAWTLLTKRKQFPALGWVKSVEVTRSKDGLAHPHFHALLMVNPGYFKNGYLSQATWTELWKASLRIDYTPIVNVKTVKPRATAGDDPGSALAAGLLETLKYGVKESDLVADQDWLVGLTQQLHKTRAVAVGGELRQFLKDDEPEDLIHTDDEIGMDEVTDDSPRLVFGWRERIQRYVYKENHEQKNERDSAEQSTD